MNLAARLLAILILALTVAHAIGLFAPRPLAHRPITPLTNHGQDMQPLSNLCPPGTIRFNTDDGLFLECYRGSNGQTQ